ncbi:MAG: tetratricopeptide repeat protein [Myxococcaceae bacterium]|nr:tetratricopeptide repeat protein [Myxococcaceae bacterium]
MALWRGSDHDLAMQEATGETVLGHFGGARFTHFGVTSSFFKKDGTFFARTDGPDGAMHDYPIAYTFGVRPLQQYLIALPRGRLQALNVAWDSRPKREGGQRWFHLAPDEAVEHDDILHWTGPYQNWNFMCAECHSTNVQKNYRASDDSYATTWSELAVSCEACHGPGSRHVAWASGGAATGSAEAALEGFVFRLVPEQKPAWTVDAQTGLPRRLPAGGSVSELETCARCHARRSVVAPYQHGRPLLDSYRPALLTEQLYFADGQLEEEVYEYGSFLQSRMYAHGVSCTDCHDAHSLRVRGGEQGVCLQCHPAERFDTPAHHHHRAEARGSRCVECHMPARTYMVVDARRDHSLRVPRPDLTVKIGTPNACNGCHAKRSAQWAASAALRWWGPRTPSRPHYGEALHAGREGLPGAEQALSALAVDAETPAIVRATALQLLRQQLGPASLPVVKRALSDREALVRHGALLALEGAPPPYRVPLAAPLLGDAVRTVRLTAARILAAAPREGLPPQQRKALAAGIAEYQESLRVDADRAEAHLNLGVLHQDLGELPAAEADYLAALRLSPRYPRTYVNLADLYRAQGRDDESERVLRQGLAVTPRNADVLHALGLLRVRQRRMAEAVEALRQASELAPDNARYAYVLGVALHSTGAREEGLATLRRAQARHPGDPDIRTAVEQFAVER